MAIWEIRYNGPKEPGLIQREFNEEPSRELAAQWVRDALFPVGFLIPDTPRGIADKTVWQLEQQGIRIVEIVELDLTDYTDEEEEADGSEETLSLLSQSDDPIVVDETLSPKGMDIAEVRAGLREPD